LNVLDLFSGIGGFSLALESTGFFKTIAFVEKDKFCQKVLRKNFPNVPIEDDVRNVKGEKYRADVVTGGFPCQPFSVAGKRRGTDDDRFLWDETIRIVSETKPKWFIGENVEGIINIQDGMVFRQIHDDLESEGFETQSLIIPASGKGAWHQRKRVWIIGCNVSNTNDIRSVRVQEPEEEIIGGSKATSNPSSSHDVSNTKYTRSQNQSRRRFGELEKKSKREKKARYQSSICFTSSSSDVSNSESLRDGGGNSEKCRDQQWEFQPSEQKGSSFRSEAEGCSKQNLRNTESTRRESSFMGQGKGEFRGASAWGKQCESNWFETISKLCGVPHGVSSTMDKDRANRIKSLGNSIVPQIAREIGLGIMEAEIG